MTLFSLEAYNRSTFGNHTAEAKSYPLLLPTEAVVACIARIKRKNFPPMLLLHNKIEKIVNSSTIFCSDEQRGR